MCRTQNVAQRCEYDNNPSERCSSVSRGDWPQRCLHVCYVAWSTCVKGYCISLSVTAGSAKSDRTECNFTLVCGGSVSFPAGHCFCQSCRLMHSLLNLVEQCCFMLMRLNKSKLVTCAAGMRRLLNVKGRKKTMSSFITMFRSTHRPTLMSALLRGSGIVR